ncbi:MAG: membrane protein insertion efficiency factor YidD [Planctomycetota bacterium]
MNKVTIPFIWAVRVYQIVGSPISRKIGINCRFYPTCSEYMILSLKKYGVLTGLKKGIARWFRCRPDNHQSCIDYP